MNNFETINIEREMYSSRNFSEILEKLDPSDQYIGTDLEGLDAYSRQLKRFDIKVSGSSSDTVEMAKGDINEQNVPKSSR